MASLGNKETRAKVAKTKADILGRVTSRSQPVAPRTLLPSPRSALDQDGIERAQVTIDKMGATAAHLHTVVVISWAGTADKTITMRHTLGRVPRLLQSVGDFQVIPVDELKWTSTTIYVKLQPNPQAPSLTRGAFLLS
jgi:hypothetical protein